MDWEGPDPVGDCRPDPHPQQHLQQGRRGRQEGAPLASSQPVLPTV